jgi:hypothetical protein
MRYLVRSFLLSLTISSFSKMKNLAFIFLLAISTFGLMSCEDVINVKIPNSNPQVQVDGWLYSDTSYQEIKLSYTTTYFDTTLPPPVIGASLMVIDVTAGDTFDFQAQSGNPGLYTSNNLRPILDHKYLLDIKNGSSRYVALDEVKRVPVIDSISFRFEVANPLSTNKIPQLKVWSRDIPGSGDYYKFNVILNGKLLNTFQDIVIQDDRATDGLIFIEPVNIGLNRKEYKKGDTIELRLISLTAVAYTFWTSVNNSVNNTGLFSTPANNVLTNVFNVDAQSKDIPVGFFGCSAVSRKKRVIGQ